MSGLPNDKEAKVLALLLEHGEQTGLGLVEKSDGKLKRWNVYVLLRRMESNSLLSSRQEDEPKFKDLPRRFYKPTPEGEQAFARWKLGQVD